MRNIRSFMKQNDLKTWNQITEFYLANAQRTEIETTHVNRRHASVRRGLEQLAQLLPTKDRRRINEIITEVTGIVREYTGNPLAE